MVEPETKMTTKPLTKGEAWDRAEDEIWERGSLKPHKDFENLNLKIYNLAIVRAIVNDNQ